MMVNVMISTTIQIAIMMKEIAAEEMLRVNTALIVVARVIQDINRDSLIRNETGQKLTSL